MYPYTSYFLQNNTLCPKHKMLKTGGKGSTKQQKQEFCHLHLKIMFCHLVLPPVPIINNYGPNNHVEWKFNLTRQI